MADPAVKLRISATDEASPAVDRVAAAFGRYEAALSRLEEVAGRGTFDSPAEALERQREAARRAAKETERAGESARHATEGFGGLGLSLGAIAKRLIGVTVGIGTLIGAFRKIIAQTPQFQALSTEIGSLASRFVTAASTAIELSGAFDRAGSSAKGYASAAQDAGTSTGNFIAAAGSELVAALGAAEGLLNRVKATLDSWGLTINQNVRGLLEWTGALAGSSSSVNAYAAGLERLNRILTEERLALSDVAATAAELGVTLESQASSQIERLGDAVERARVAAQNGVITWADYGKLVEAAAQKTAQLRGEVDATATGAEAASALLDELAEATGGFGDEAIVTVGKARQLANQLNATARAAAQATANLNQFQATTSLGTEAINGGSRVPVLRTMTINGVTTTVRVGSRIRTV